MSDYSIYPKAIDGYSQIPLAVDKKSPINAESVNRLRSGIINIEKAVGIAPGHSSDYGSFSSLSERLSHVEALLKGSLGKAPGTMPIRLWRAESSTVCMVLEQDYTIVVDAEVGAVEVVLLDPSTCVGKIFNIKKIDDIHSVQITSSEGLIDGGVSHFLDNQWESVIFQSDGNNWYKIG